MQVHEWRKSGHVVNIAPRAHFGPAAEADAWKHAIRFALWRPRPVYLFCGRRVLGVTMGKYFDDRVAVHRFRHGTPWSEMEKVKNDLYQLNWNDANQMISDLTAGQFGRTYFMKTATGTPVASNWWDLWPVAGSPASGAINGTAFNAVQFSESSVGAIPHRGNVSTMTKNLLSIWACVSGNTPMLMLYDRVLAYDLCTFNASVNQAMTNTNAAQRYNTAAPGLLVSLVTNTTASGATACNLTQLQYTNQAGTTLQSVPTSPTMTFIPSAAVASSTAGARVICPITSGQTVPWTFSLPLATGDTGVRLIANYTTSAANTGTFTAVLMHPLTDIMLPLALVPFERDCVFQVSELERIYDGACPALMTMTPATTVMTAVTGGIRFGWGSH